MPALTYDHRLLDGREAVTFLVRLKQVSPLHHLVYQEAKLLIPSLSLAPVPRGPSHDGSLSLFRAGAYTSVLPLQCEGARGGGGQKRWRGGARLAEGLCFAAIVSRWGAVTI